MAIFPDRCPGFVVIQLIRNSLRLAPFDFRGGSIRAAAAALLGAALCPSCLPTINLATPEPVKVDVGVRLDIYQKTPTKPKSETSSLEIAKDRRLRSGEI